LQYEYKKDPSKPGDKFSQEIRKEYSILKILDFLVFVLKYLYTRKENEKVVERERKSETYHPEKEDENTKKFRVFVEKIYMYYFSDTSLPNKIRVVVLDSIRDV
jgi:hypothetical protein